MPQPLAMPLSRTCLRHPNLAELAEAPGCPGGASQEVGHQEPPRLVKAALAGEEVILASHAKAQVRLVPCPPTAARKAFSKVGEMRLQP